MFAESIAVVALVAGSFAATNLDNLALLVGWLLARPAEARTVLLGHLAGMVSLLALSIAFGLGAGIVPERYVGYLGCIPIALGLKGLYDIFRARGDTRREEVATRDERLTASIATTQIANGTDTILVIGPLLADSEIGVDFVMIAGFVVMSFVWFGIARAFQRHAGRIAVVERYGHWVAPIVLIVVGAYILADTATDVVPG